MQKAAQEARQIKRKEEGLTEVVDKLVNLATSVTRQVTNKLRGYKEKLENLSEEYGPKIYSAFQLQTEFAGDASYMGCNNCDNNCNCDSCQKCQRRD